MRAIKSICLTLPPLCWLAACLYWFQYDRPPVRFADPEFYKLMAWATAPWLAFNLCFIPRRDRHP